MTDSIGRIFKQVALFAGVVLAWGMFAMSISERFIGPFKVIEREMMPWQGLFSGPARGSFEDRIYYMEGLLDRSILVGNIGLLLVVTSFVALVVYATYLFLQKQQRARENELLLIKNSEIARRNEFIRYISATIGHEFKNNLGRIKRRLALLDLPKDARGNIDTNLDKLFADINIFKKISDEREAGLINFELVNIRHMLNEMSGNYDDLLEINMASSGPKPLIFAAKTLLRTVFENLLDNAVKYKKQGDAKASLNVSCSLDVDGSRRYMSLSFKDNGVGMEERQAEQCFYKGIGTGEGWGEGLYFAKYVIGLHAGKIRVGKEYTALGKGTEIIIKLPYVEETPDV
jgi:signal transduction histidine kinase